MSLSPLVMFSSFLCHPFLPLNMSKFLIINIIVYFITAGSAVLLTIITYFSTPILTKIFGDGSLEVHKARSKTDYKCFLLSTREKTWRTGLITARQQYQRYVIGNQHRGFTVSLWQVDQEANDTERQVENLVNAETLSSSSTKVKAIGKGRQKI